MHDAKSSVHFWFMCLPAACWHPHFPRKVIILCGHSAACHFRGESTLRRCRCGESVVVPLVCDSRGRPAGAGSRRRWPLGLDKQKPRGISLKVANPGTDRQIGHILVCV
jgi:hypothetical protein